MKNLIENDGLGNWKLKGVSWQQLREGAVITKDVAEKIYGALCKLKDLEAEAGEEVGIQHKADSDAV